jgi:crossover junction endodeoxyribonuclease RusA
VRTAARGAIPEEREIYGEFRGVLVFFYFAETDLDVDNIIKPISDALSVIAFFDDRDASEWLARKTDLRCTSIIEPPPAVAAALGPSLAAEQPFVYVCIVDEAPKHAEVPQ